MKYFLGPNGWQKLKEHHNLSQQRRTVIKLTKLQNKPNYTKKKIVNIKNTKENMNTI